LLKNVYLKLQPKNFKSKKRQKRRSPTFFNKFKSLNFGEAGLVLLGSLIFTSSHLEKMKLYLKKARRKSDKTHRKI
jgi:ribosomal protein L16/L10AE